MNHQQSTRHIISRREFAKMKKGIVIVNTARGAIIDEAALVEALDSGHVSSAGLDVYENEPSIHPGLLANPRILLVPHMGTWTVETERKMEEWYVHETTPLDPSTNPVGLCCLFCHPLVKLIELV
jgi:phosphoglycerate dehydrogenase-like enzyme